MLNKKNSETCHVCNARLKSSLKCRRCKANLAPLSEIKSKAKHHTNRALSAFNLKQFQVMFYHAKKAHTLFCTNDSVKLMACAALLTNQFQLATCLHECGGHDT